MSNFSLQKNLRALFSQRCQKLTIFCGYLRPNFENMKIALFAAVPEEVGNLANITNFMGIGRENATRSTLEFIEKHRNEQFCILNLGTVGSHDKEVGSILKITEVISAGEPFNEDRMILPSFPITHDDVGHGVLYSSDCFVSPDVFTDGYLNSIKGKADCFDMESSAVYTVAKAYNIPFISYKIVSDNLDVTIDIWRERVHELSKKLEVFAQGMFQQLEEIEPIEFLHD